ncbi:TonB-dependent receptor [Sphingomonas sp. CL5.1]|uniref:TonB-dependent receptor n=1 Tax=Sphingomonas sp. CL5.1 TaxID=2653203 RepID=UPI0015819F04|nr:TonB-dependent receptor [Sphingomonas sp. CL5.1]QKR98402.1 TonB-dependent receptor [Sphingomonas sp. CL5.1]
MKIFTVRAPAATLLTGASALVMAAGLAFTASEARAQDAAAAPAPQHNAGPALDPDSDIVVTARRQVESLQTVPVAVQAIGGATLAKYAVNDISSISQLVPSMVVGRQASGSSASIFLRGVGSSPLSSGFDQSVSLNLDGLAMSRGKELLTSQYDLARVEVLKGPQALFFGKNSTGGVITLTSADPTDVFEMGAKMGYEFQAREMYGEAYISGPITDKLKGRFAFRGSTSEGPYYNTAQSNSLGGFFRPVFSDRRGASTTKAGRVTLKYDDPDFVNVTLKASLTQVDDDSASAIYERKCAAGGTTPRPTNGIAEPYTNCVIDGHNGFAAMPQQIANVFPYARDGRPYTDYDAYTVVLTLEKDIGPVTLTSVTGQYGFRQEDLQSASGSTAGIYFTQRNKQRQFSQEFRAVTNFDGPFNITAGAYYADQSYRFNTAAMVGATIPRDPVTGRYDSFYRENGINGKTYSAFAELRWKLVDTLELAGGARYSREEKDSFVRNTYASPYVPTMPANAGFTDRYRENNVSPQATLTWTPTSDFMLYGAYKEGFKAGGYNTSLTILTSSKAGDGRFGSEKARGFEAGVRTQSFDRQLRFNVTAYSYGYYGLQVQVFDAQTIASRVANAGELRTKGVETELNFRPTGSPFELHASVAYNDAKFHDYIGSCYTGQTIAEGCNLTAGPTGAFNNQSYDGRTAPKAPKWAGRIGASYDAPIASGWRLGLNGDVSFSSRYNYTDTLRPDGYQSAFQRIDAGIRVFTDDNRWEVALIGRNLTNKYVVTSANDMPAQGASGTGTTSGVRSDMNAMVDRPRSIFLQTSFKF